MSKLLLFLSMMLFVIPVYAQNSDEVVHCGDIVEREFTTNRQNFFFVIDLRAGDRLHVSGEPIGDVLRFTLSMFAPNSSLIASGTRSNFNGDPLSNPAFDTPVLSANGTYTIKARNAAINVNHGGDISASDGGVGVFLLYIGCTLRDGTVINAGDNFQEVALPGGSPAASAPAFSGFGFPGLAPVDFTDVARLPIPAGIPMSGAVTPGGSEILGYQFDAGAGDTVELSFNRLSGNLNLGLVVIDDESNVIYQVSLVTTQSMTARFTVPTGGQYTAGVFRISLLPPAAPEPTAFQVMATVNP